VPWAFLTEKVAKWSFSGIEELSGKRYTISGLFSIQYGYIRKEKS